MHVPAAQLAGQLRRDAPDRGAHGLRKDLGGVARRGRPQLVGAVSGHCPVQANHRVEVHQPALVILARLGVGEAHLLAQRSLRDPQQAGDRAWQVDRRPAPQLADCVVPGHRAWVVETLRADWLPQTVVTLVVDVAAGHPNPVRTDDCIPPRAAAQRPPIRGLTARVHRPERRRGQCDEHGRVLHHAVGYALAAPQPGGDQVVGVLAVALSTRRTNSFAAVGACLAQNPVGLVAG
jgi:hypothetical protein